MELVKVVNTGDKDLVLRHDAEGDLTVAPGKARIVPLHYATIAFGNPGAYNDGRNNVRDVEYAAKQTLWGFYPGMHPEAAWTERVVNPVDGNEVGPFLPSFEVYDMEDNRIYMLLEDPTGEHAAEARGAVVDQTDSGYVNARIGELERQIEQLTQFLAAQQGDTDVPVPGGAGSADEGSTDWSTADKPATADETASDVTVADNSGAGVDTSGQGSDGDQGAKETQESRNEQRADELPAPKAGAVKKDAPKSTRVGGN